MIKDCRKKKREDWNNKKMEKTPVRTNAVLVADQDSPEMEASAPPEDPRAEEPPRVGSLSKTIKTSLPTLTNPLRVKAKLNGAPVDTLLDTGADVDLIAHSIALELGLEMKPTDLSFRAVDGGPHLAKGVVNLTLQLSFGTIHSSFYVADITEDVIVGVHTLKKHGLLADIIARTAPREPIRVTNILEKPLESHSSVEFEAVPEYDPTFNVQPLIGEGPVGKPIVEGPYAVQIINLLEEFQSVFDEKLPPEGARLPPLKLQLRQDARVQRQNPRTIRRNLVGFVQDELKKLLNAGIIRPSNSEWGAPVMVAQGNGRDPRLCIDYTLLNKQLVDTNYPMAKAQTLLDRLRGAKIFGKLDLRSGFHQLKVAPEDVHLTAFVVEGGLFEYTRMPFGLMTAPRVFQQRMDTLLGDLDGVLVYIDDILIFAEDISEFLKTLRAVLERLQASDLRAKAAKCRFGTSSLTFLGHEISAQGISLTDDRKQGFKMLKAPTDVHLLRKMLGAANYFRQFVKNYAELTEPFTSLLRKGAKFVWGPDQSDAFEELKQALIRSPVLLFPNPAAELVLRTDASEVGIGAVLFNRDPGESTGRPIGYFAKTLQPAERKWTTGDLESFAIVSAVKHWKHLLHGVRFTIETDHRNLVFIQSDPSARVVRWRHFLAEFNFILQHIPGETNVTADMLSRCCVTTRSHQDTDQSNLSLGEEATPKQTQEEEDLEGIRQQKNEDSRPSFPDAIIKRFHNAINGHHGIARTMRLIQEAGLAWPGLLKDLKRFMQSCAECQKLRLPQQPIVASPRPTFDFEPFRSVSMDTLGPFEPDNLGRTHIVAFVDAFSRWTELVPTTGTSASETAKALLTLVGRFGVPAFLRSDNAPDYTAKVIDELLLMLGTERKLTLPYHPQANGLVERTHRETLRHLRALAASVTNLGQDWSNYIPLVQRIINSSFHSAIGTSPARLLFAGRLHLEKGILPFPTAPSKEEEGERSEPLTFNPLQASDFVKELFQKQEELIRVSLQAQNDYFERRNQASQKNGASPTEFAIGDLVVFKPPIRNGKLETIWRGPYVVLSRENDIYQVKDSASDKTLRLHIERLKPFKLAPEDDAAAISARDNNLYLVDRILRHRFKPLTKKTKAVEFEVAWLGYDQSFNEWLPLNRVKHLYLFRPYLALNPALSAKLGRAVL